MQIVRLFLTPDTLNPPNIRWADDCDCIQQTPDGTTWVDVPALDPRHADGFRLPPLTGEDARCDAAARMVAYLHRLVDIDLLAITNWTLASSLLATLLLVIPGGVLVDLILIVADVILTIGSTAINDAFTSEVYDDLICTYFCHLQEDGQLSESGLAALAADIEANYSSVVLAVWTVHNRTLFEVGWSNAAVVGTETGDCSGCVECAWCYQWDTLADMEADGFTISTDTDSKAAVTATSFALTHASFNWSTDGGTGSGSGAGLWRNAAGSDPVLVYVPLATAPEPFVWDGDNATSGLYLGGNCVASSGTFNMFNIRLAGTGSDPGFVHATPC